MTDTPKIVPTETKESGAPAEAKPAAVGPAAPAEKKPAAEPDAPKK